MDKFSWQQCEKTGEGRIEAFYGLEGYQLLIRDELVGLGNLINANQLPERAFQRAGTPSPYTVGGSVEVSNVKPGSIDLSYRLTNEAPAPSAGKRQRFPWLGILGSMGRKAQFSDYDFVVTESLQRSKELKGKKVPSLLSGREHRRMKTGLRVSQVRWDAQTLQGAVAFDLCQRESCRLLIESISDDDQACLDVVPAIHLEGVYGQRIKPRPEGEWPKISLVIVSFNQVDFLEEALISVLDQEYLNLELIVVDGNSTDGSADLLRRYQDKIDILIIEDDKGQSDALNKGFALATGEIMNWLCSDDLLEPGALLVIAEAWLDSGADLIAGGCRVINGEGDLRWDHHTGFPLCQKLPLSFGDLISFHSVWQAGCYFYQPEVYFTREIWERSGGFVRTDLYYAMDYEMYLRFALGGAELYHVPQFIACSRQHEEQKTQHGMPEYLPTIDKIVKEFRDLFNLSDFVVSR